MTEAHAVNVVLGYLARGDHPTGEAITAADAETAAKVLASRANKALMAGITPEKVAVLR